MAPQVGLEPTTLRLTAGCSAIELLRSVGEAEQLWVFYIIGRFWVPGTEYVDATLLSRIYIQKSSNHSLIIFG